MKKLIIAFLITYSVYSFCGTLENNLLNNIKIANKTKISDTLDRGADINGNGKVYLTFTTAHTTPLTLASQGNKEDIVSYLINRGADVNLENEAGMTPLISAVRFDRIGNIKILLSKGADINYKNKYGNNAVMFAAADSNSETLELLINSRGDVNSRNSMKQTPLMAAVTACNIEKVEILLKRGADVNNRDIDGKTAVMIAREKGYQDIIAVLNLYGAK